MCVCDRRPFFELRRVVHVPSWCTAFNGAASGLATYCSLVDSLSLHVRLSLSAQRDYCSSASKMIHHCGVSLNKQCICELMIFHGAQTLHNSKICLSAVS